MSAEKQLSLNIEEKFSESLVIIRGLKKVLQGYLDIPEASDEPYKIKMLRSLDRIFARLLTFDKQCKQFSEFAVIAGLLPQHITAILQELKNFAPDGIPEVRDELTYLLTVAYHKAVVVIKDFFAQKRYIFFPSYPDILASKANQLAKLLANSLVREEAEKILKNQFVIENNEKPTVQINPQNWQEERNRQLEIMRNQTKKLNEKFKELEKERSEKQDRLLAKRATFQETCSRLVSLTRDPIYQSLPKSILDEEACIIYLTGLGQLITKTPRKTKRILDEIEKKFELSKFIEMLGIEREKIFNAKDNQNKSEKILKKLLSTDKIKEKNKNTKTCRAYLLEKLNQKISEEKKQVVVHRKSLEKDGVEIARLDTLSKNLSQEIATLEKQIAVITKKISDDVFRNIFADQDDLAYYDKVAADNNVFENCQLQVKTLLTKLIELQNTYDYCNPKASYISINDMRSEIEKIENKIKSLTHGVDKNKIDLLLNTLEQLSKQLLTDANILKTKHANHQKRITELQAVNDELISLGIKGIFTEDMTSVFKQFWKEKLDSYWNARCKKYVLKDLLSCCFFNNDKEDRHTFINTLKSLMLSYRFNPTDTMFKNYVNFGLEKFKSGILSDTTDDYKNLHGLLTKLQQSITILEKHYDTLNKVPEKTTFLHN